MGFCFGVREAVNMVRKVVDENKGRNIFMLGMLVHNKSVVEDLKTIGVETIEESEIKNLSSGDLVIIRAHGITADILNELTSKNVKIYDATCIFVSKICKFINFKFWIFKDSLFYFFKIKEICFIKNIISHTCINPSI